MGDATNVPFVKSTISEKCNKLKHNKNIWFWGKFNIPPEISSYEFKMKPGESLCFSPVPFRYTGAVTEEVEGMI